MRLSVDGISASLTGRWEGAVTRRGSPTPRRTDGPRRRRGLSSAPRPPAVHLGTFALPAERGDFGAGAVEEMAGGDAFVALVEYGPEAAGTPLFSRRGLPRRLDVGRFHPRALQRILPGQAGRQIFFAESERAFCLYVVLGSRARAGGLVAEVNDALAGIEVQPR